MSAVTVGMWALLWRDWEAVVACLDRLVLWAMLAFGLAGTVSMFAALHPLEALWDVARWWMVMGCAVALAFGMAQDPKVLRDSWRAGAVAGLLIGGIRLLQYLGWVSGIPAGGDPEAATLGNQNFFAGAVALLVIFGVAAAWLESGLWRWVGGASALLCLLLAIFGRSTGSWMALGMMGIVVLEGSLAQWLKWKPIWHAAFWILVGTVALIAFGWVLTWKTDSIPSGADSTLERVALWKKSLEMAGGAPVLGVGPGHWHYHILRLGLVSNYQGFATRYFMEAHNDYLQLLAERGIVGGIGFLGMLVLAWRNGWKAMTKGNGNRSLLFAWAGLTGWMAFAATNLPGEQPYLTAILVVLMAMLIPRTDTQATSTALGLRTPLRRLMGLAFLVFAALSLLIHGLWMKADRINFDLLTAKGQADWPKTQRLAQNAVSWYNPHDRISGTPILWYKAIAYLTVGDAKSALPPLLAAKAQHPWHPQVASNLGAAYFMLGDYKAAIDELQDCVNRFPDFGEVRMNLSEAYLTVGDNVAAAKTIDYWRTHSGNPRFDGYYAKIYALLHPQPSPTP